MLAVEHNVATAVRDIDCDGDRDSDADIEGGSESDAVPHAHADTVAHLLTAAEKDPLVHADATTEGGGALLSDAESELERRVLAETLEEPHGVGAAEDETATDGDRKGDANAE